MSDQAQNATTTEPATPAPTEGAPPTAAEADPKGAATAPITDPDDPDAPAAGEPPKSDPPGPDTAKLAAEVMRTRSAKQLASLVREKKQLEAQAAKHKERSADLAALDRFNQLYDDDPAAALEYMLAHRAGDPEKARVALATAYDGLTSRILKVDSKNEIPAKVERSVSRLEKEIEVLKQEKAQAEAKQKEREEAEESRRIQGAIEQIGGWLTEEEQQKAYPYLSAEADDPQDIVWGILHEAQAQDVQLTVAEAAAIANDHFKPIAEKKAPRYTNLLAPIKAGDTPSKPETSKSPTSTSRKSLTNADASKTTSPEPTPKPKSDQERFELSWQKLREGHRT